MGQRIPPANRDTRRTMRNAPIGRFPNVLNVTVTVGVIAGFVGGSMYVPHFFLALPAYFAACAVGAAVWGNRASRSTRTASPPTREAGGEERIVNRPQVALAFAASA